MSMPAEIKHTTKGVSLMLINNYTVKGDIAIITIISKFGEHNVLIDRTSLDIVRAYKWRLCPRRDKTGKFYVVRSGATNRRSIYLHRFIIGEKSIEGLEVDHINGNPLDNRRRNLRIATRKQNSCNVTINRSNNKTGYKGVSKWRGKYQAYIFLNGRNKFICYSNDPKTAARAYNREAKRIFGEFANLNKI